jgi:hypothetical protein
MAANKEEIMKVRGSRRLVRWLGLALAVAAFAAPSAQAVVAEGVSGSPDSTKLRLYADDLPASVSKSPVSVQTRLYADDLHGLPSSPVAVETRGYAPINELARPDLAPVSTQAISDSSGFDWSDATIGAGIAFVLMGFGAVILAAKQTRRSRLSPV